MILATLINASPKRHALRENKYISYTQRCSSNKKLKRMVNTMSIELRHTIFGPSLCNQIIIAACRINMYFRVTTLNKHTQLSLISGSGDHDSAGSPCLCKKDSVEEDSVEVN